MPFEYKEPDTSQIEIQTTPLEEHYGHLEEFSDIAGDSPLDRYWHESDYQFSFGILNKVQEVINRIKSFDVDLKPEVLRQRQQEAIDEVWTESLNKIGARLTDAQDNVGRITERALAMSERPLYRDNPAKQTTLLFDIRGIQEHIQELFDKDPKACHKYLREKIHEDDLFIYALSSWPTSPLDKSFVQQLRTEYAYRKNPDLSLATEHAISKCAGLRARMGKLNASILKLVKSELDIDASTQVLESQFKNFPNWEKDPDLYARMERIRQGILKRKKAVGK